MKGLDLLAHLVFPGQCLLCGGRLRDQDFPLVCSECIPESHPLERPCSVCGKEMLGELGTCLVCRGREVSFHRHHSLFDYRDNAARLVRGYKFEHRRPLKAVFSALFHDGLEARYPGLPVVPVPGGRRCRDRGWDPMGEIARDLGRVYGHRVERLVARRAGASAKSLGARALRPEVRRQYFIHPRVKQRAEPLPKDVVLVDDIYTTGSTLSACAEVLRNAGIERVYALTWARD